MASGAGTVVNHSSHSRPSEAAAASASACSGASGSRRTPSRSRTMGRGSITKYRSSQLFDPRRGVAEAIELHTHPVHQRQVQAAGPALVVRPVDIVEDPTRL